MSRIANTSDLWWKTAVIYCVDVETYQDSDGDGIGDLAGLTSRVDYLAELGITCLWLMPFFPTPDRDDGYDVTDLFGVDHRLGTLGDLVELVRTANDRGIRVIADLVVNHTSDKHPWFRQARRSTTNRYRDYYVWRADAPPDTSEQVVFPDKETSIWEKDEQTGEWYLHHFYSHQPDLNFANPAVRDEVAKSMGLWLQLGLAGFRVDAVPFLVQDVETEADHVPADPHDYLRALRAFLGRRRGDAVLLGEVNLARAEQRRYFGGSAGDELQMMFDFISMQALYLALARQDARPIGKALRGRPSIHPDCQWATFVRNHDELTLDKLTDQERARSSTPSGRTRPCRSTVAASNGGFRRCSTVTRDASGWSTACCSRCPAPPRSTTARRSAWGRTSTPKGGWRSGRRCSGPRDATAGSPMPGRVD